MGFNIQIIPVSFIFSAYYAFEKALKEFNDYGHTKFISDKMYNIPNFNKIMGIDIINKLIEKYGHGEKPCINCQECLSQCLTEFKNEKNDTNIPDYQKDIINKVTKEILKNYE